MSEQSWEERTIEAANRADLWREIASTLEGAADRIEYAQGTLEDVNVDAPEIASALDVHVEKIKAFARDARARARLV